MDCTKRGAITYLTFWAVAAFSFFIASDAIATNDAFPREATSRGIYALATVARTSVHGFSLNVMGLTLVEANAPSLETWMCRRKPYVEHNTAASSFFLFVLFFTACLTEAFPATATERGDVAPLKLIPCAITLLIGLVNIVELRSLQRVPQ